jgi:hypothetical protein
VAAWHQIAVSLLVNKCNELRETGEQYAGGRILRSSPDEELHDLYSSPSIITIIKARWMRWVGHVARMGEKRNAYRLLVGKPEGRRPLGRPRRS